MKWSLDHKGACAGVLGGVAATRGSPWHRPLMSLPFWSRPCGVHHLPHVSFLWSSRSSASASATSSLSAASWSACDKWVSDRARPRPSVIMESFSWSRRKGLPVLGRGFLFGGGTSGEQAHTLPLSTVLAFQSWPGVKATTLENMGGTSDMGRTSCDDIIGPQGGMSEVIKA